MTTSFWMRALRSGPRRLKADQDWTSLTSAPPIDVRRDDWQAPEPTRQTPETASGAPGPPVTRRPNCPARSRA